MPLQPPARVGMSLAEVDTPALIIDLPVFERNLGAMAHAVPVGVRLRPHAKTHKCAEIAKRQIASGAIGVCCQKVSEAEALVEEGIANIFVSNEVVGSQKLNRLAALATRAEVSVAVDNPINVIQLDRALEAVKKRIDVLVEVNVGANRCGVEPGEPALALVREIARAAHLRFTGLHAYQGAAQHLRPVSDRAAAVARASELASQTKHLLEANGYACPIVTGGGSGTFMFEAASGVYNEIQPGSYVFMDADYARNLADPQAPRFEQSLFVFTTVMSRSDAYVVVDAGLKAHSVDSGLPMVAIDGWEYAQASDEHGVLKRKDTAPPLDLGQKLKLIPGHCDPTVNLHDWYVCIRDQRVEAVWPIDARGALL